MSRLPNGHAVYSDTGEVIDGPWSRSERAALGLGHNEQGSFQADADEVVRIGPTITSFRRIGFAIRDRHRIKRHHLQVLYAYMEALNQKTGTAFLSRRALAEQEGLQYEVVENALYDLRRWGYIDWEKRAAPQLHKGALLHYTLPVLRWTDEQLTTAILELRAKLSAEKYTTEGVHNGGCTQPRVPKSTRPVVTRNWKRELDSTPLPPKGGVDAVAQATLGGGHGAEKPPASVAVKKRKRPRTELAPDWRPGPDLVAWVKNSWAASDAQIAEQAEQFADHHRAKASTMADWSAAWRTWWRNNYHKIPKRSGGVVDDAAVDAALEQARRARGLTG